MLKRGNRSYHYVSDNIQYEVVNPRKTVDPILDNKKLIPSKTYAGRELISVLEGMVELVHFEADDQVIKKIKLRGITEMVLNSNELDNGDNLKDGRPRNALLTYHVTDEEIVKGGFWCSLPLFDHFCGALMPSM